MKVFASRLLQVALVAFLVVCEGFVANTPSAGVAVTKSAPFALHSSAAKFVPTKEIPPIPSSSSDSLLIELANDYIYTKSGFYSAYDESIYSEDFVFRGPYIGPLDKKDYLATMDTFKIYQGLPDISPNAWGFSIDPKDSNRVWFMVRNSGTFNGEPGIGLGNGQYIKPNGAKLEGCPETFSITFDENKKIKYLTVGYVADRFEGNTNGTGAAVGIFNAIGFPFPSPGPLLSFAQWMGTEIINMSAKSYSKEGVPSWWKSAAKGGEGYR
jgi:hypothetical protein